MSFAEDPIQAFHQGQTVVLFVDFTNASEEAADPDTVTLIYIDGEGVETPVAHGALEHPATGRYEYSVAIPLDGDKAAAPWSYRFEGESAAVDGVNAAGEWRFEVRASPFYPPG